MSALPWLQNIAVWAWHTSVAVALPALVLLALGYWRGFSARWRVFLVGVMFVRLILPVVPAVTWRPALPFTDSVSQVETATATQVGGTLDSPQNDAVYEAGSLHTAFQSVSWTEILVLTWAAGFIGVMAWLLGSHLLLQRWVAQKAKPADAMVARLFHDCCERMNIADAVALAEVPHLMTAAVCGWWRPQILIPADLRQTHSADEIRGILLHELAHVKRWDVLWTWLGLMVCALHWFNPLAWLTLRRFHADREILCDRAALDHLTTPQREAYAPALFKTLQQAIAPQPAALVPFFRNRHEIHQRILTIMKPTRSLAATFVAVLFVPAISFIALTKAGADEPGRDSPEARAKDGDSANKKHGARDGDVKKEGPRDGQRPKKTGPKDGEGPRASGARDGDRPKTEPRDGEGATKKDNAAPLDGKTIILEVKGQGEQVSVNGESVPTRQLRGYLSEYLAKHAGMPVVIQAEASVPRQVALDVWDAARDCGAKDAKLLSDHAQQEHEGEGRKSVEER